MGVIEVVVMGVKGYGGYGGGRSGVGCACSGDCRLV